MDADILIDDELHARQPDAVIGQHGGVESEVRIAQIDHDLGLGRGMSLSFTSDISKASMPS